MSSSEITVNDFSKHLFWDVDLRKFDLYHYKGFMVQRVLEYGVLKDWKLLRKAFGDETIAEEAKKLRTLNAVSLSFLCTIYNLEENQFRCYRHRQLAPNLWNS